MEQYRDLWWISWLLITMVLSMVKGLDVVNLQEYCGLSISRDAGSVRFDAQKLPEYRTDNECSITITGQMTSLYQTYIMFYFTKFNLSTDSCADAKLIVKDTRYENKPIQGLPEYLCGHNKTVEKDGHFYRTWDDRLTLTFKYRDLGSSEILKGEFILNFVAFHEDSCAGSEEHKCPDKRCIPKKYLCDKDLKSCGAEEDSSCVKTEDKVLAEQILDKILDTIKKYSWLIVLAAGIFILFNCYRRNKEAICSWLQKTFGFCPLGRNDNTHQYTNYEHAEIPLTSVGDDHIHVRRSSADSVILTSVDQQQPERPPGGMDTDAANVESPPSGNQNFPSPPPPSYAEVMAPSYEECMTNQDKYTIK